MTFFVRLRTFLRPSERGRASRGPVGALEGARARGTSRATVASAGRTRARGTR